MRISSSLFLLLLACSPTVEERNFLIGEGEGEEGEGEEGEGEEGEGEEGEGEEGEGEEGEGEGEALPPTRDAYFCVPNDEEPFADTTLEDVILGLLQLAQPGSNVHVAMFEWDRELMAQGFIDAHNRGVNVRILLDDNPDADGVPSHSDMPNAAVSQLLSALEDDFVFCPRGACIGNGINHHKFVLFESLSDGTSNVVVQSSANLKATQLLQHNNMVVTRNDVPLYAGYLSVWEDMLAQHSLTATLDYNRTIEGDPLGDLPPIRVHFSPQAVGDPLLEVLQTVSCDLPGSFVLVAMAFWKDERVAIANELATLAEAGCDVRVVLRNDNDPNNEPGDLILPALQAGGVQASEYRTSSGRSLHSKILLVDASIQGSTMRRQVVYTGSHNYTRGALENNDEALMRIEDPAMFDLFVSNWLEIRADLP
jgi:phosphatidylserine/phosphatidylglycerophosphate/cardiolipin synthase-like enzyme